MNPSHSTREVTIRSYGSQTTFAQQNVANSFDSHKITEVASMQKKYNLRARLQCAEEEKDYDWWSEDEQQQNQP